MNQGAGDLRGRLRGICYCLGPRCRQVHTCLSRKENPRSLGFARDDKANGDTSMESGCWTEGVCSAAALMQPPPYPLSSRPGFPAALRRTRPRVHLSVRERRMKCDSVTNSYRKSGGAKPRDLRFNGLVLEMFSSRRGRSSASIQRPRRSPRRGEPIAREPRSREAEAAWPSTHLPRHTVSRSNGNIRAPIPSLHAKAVPGARQSLPAEDLREQ